MRGPEQRNWILPDARVSAGLAVPGTLAAAVLLYATAFSLGVTPDGVIYLDAATRLASEGRLEAFQYGEVERLTHFPPLLPGVLSLAPLTGLPLLTFSRWMNILLLAITVFGSGVVVWIATRSLAPALIAAALTGFAADTIGVHAALLSEALFLPLQIATLLALSVYVASGSRRALIAAAAGASVACLVRFPAVVLAGTGIITILLLRREDGLRTKMRAAGLFATIACAPLALWLLTRSAVAGSATNREVAFHPVGGERVREALYTFGDWLLPHAALSTRATSILVLAAAAALAVLVWLAIRRGGPAARFATVHIAYGIGYIVFLLFSVSLLDAQTPFDRRILLPLRIALIVPFAIGLHGLATTAPRAGRIAIAAALVWIAIGAHHMFGTAVRLHENGYGYTGLAWQRIDLPRLVSAAAAREIYSNAPEAIYFLAGIPARELPAPIDRWSRRTNPDYRRQIATMRAALDSLAGAIIYFSNARRPFVSSPDQLTATLGLTSADWRGSAVILRRTAALAGTTDADSAPPAAEIVRQRHP